MSRAGSTAASSTSSRDDDAASPPKTVEQTRRLIEQDGVAFLFNPLGTASNTAIVKYVNQKKVPHLFLATGADQWGDYKEHPWTIGWQPSYRVEAQIYAKYIQRTKPDGKIGIIYQNDDFGRDYINGVRDVIGDAIRNVATVSYELTDPTVNSQLVSLKAAGVDTLISAASIKFGALVIRKVSELDWHPLHLLSNVSVSVGGVMIPAGVERGVGIISSAYLKDPTDPAWDADPDMQGWRAFMAKYYPEGDLRDAGNVYGYGLGIDSHPRLARLRRRPLPREHHAPGDRPRSRREPHPTARHHAQHQSHQLPPVAPAADDALERQDVGPLRQHHRRRRRLTRNQCVNAR